jgi:PAS domain S-box-containing protein
MNWVDLTWALMASASLTLGLLHLFVWSRQRQRLDFLAFFVLAAASAAFGLFELQVMRAPTPQVWADLVRWAHVPLAIFVVATAVFVRLHFGTGRIGLISAIAALRLATLVLGFTTGANINFEAVTALDHEIVWGGATVAVPVGVANRWAALPQLSNLLLLLFVADATRALWRRGSRGARRRALLVGGSVMLCIVVTTLLAGALVYGVARVPTVLTPTFLAVVLAMSYELSDEVMRAAQLSQALAASELRFRAVVEAVPSAILLVDAHGRIVLANAHAENMFGWPREQLVSSPVERLIPPRLRDAHGALRTGFLKEPSTRAMGAGRDLLACRQDGSEFPVEAALAPMATGQGLFVLTSVIDISERRRLEQDSVRQRNELAHLSRVALLGELSGSLAHELNQPLAAILSNAQAAQRFLAQSPPRVEQLGEILSDIVKSDHRARSVIQRLRAMLRKEAVQHQRLDLNELVEESLRLMRSDLEHREVKADAVLAAALPAVMGDRPQLQQVLLNLMINGCDAMAAGAVERRLLLRTCRNTRGQVEVSVGDRGTGIGPAELERIFEPFVTTKAQGLGLGLSICRSIVEAHGGRLWASNNADAGATLHVELPAAADL